MHFSNQTSCDEKTYSVQSRGSLDVRCSWSTPELQMSLMQRWNGSTVNTATVGWCCHWCFCAFLPCTFTALFSGHVDLIWRYGQEDVDSDDGPCSGAGGTSCLSELVSVSGLETTKNIFRLWFDAVKLRDPAQTLNSFFLNSHALKKKLKSNTSNRSNRTTDVSRICFLWSGFWINISMIIKNVKLPVNKDRIGQRAYSQVRVLIVVHIQVARQRISKQSNRAGSRWDDLSRSDL